MLTITKESLAFDDGDLVEDPRTGLRGRVLGVTCNPFAVDNRAFFLLAVETSRGGVVRLKHPGTGLRKVSTHGRECRAQEGR